jgi:MoxR-like ATPase
MNDLLLLQVAAFTNGRSRLSESDCLLLQHVLWQRPEEAERIYDWLIERLASDDGTSQSQYLLSSMFGRACRALEDPAAWQGLADEVGDLRASLEAKLTELHAGASEGLPAVADNVWLGADEAAAVASALLPKLEKSRAEVEALLFEVVTLEVRSLLFIFAFCPH